MRRVRCGWARRHKWRYLDATLPVPVARRVEAHLAVCVACRAAFAQAQAAMNALQAGKPLTPEQQRALQRPAPRLTLSRAATIGIIGVLLGAGVYLWRVQGEGLLGRLNLRSTALLAAPPTKPPPAPAAPPQERIGSPQTIPVRREALIAPPLEPKSAELVPRPVLSASQPIRPRIPSVPPRRRTRTSPAPSHPPTPPAEGVVEVYDAAGNLLKRKQVKEK